MGSRGRAQKIPTNRPKHLHPARAVTAASFQQYAACQSRIQRQWTSSTTSSVPDNLLNKMPRRRLVPLLSSLPS